MIVMKFGGTSVGSAERIRNVADIVVSRLDKGPAVVVSAVGGITDKLIESSNVAVNGESPDEHLTFIENKHHEILRELGLDESLVDDLLSEFREVIMGIKEKKEADVKTMDIVQSFGERMSSRIVAGHLTKIGHKAFACFAWDYGMITDDNFEGAEPLKSSFKVMKEKVSGVDGIPIITGFIGKNEDGEITTLGRGGSDYTAALYGAALGAEEIQIWTDVDGVMTADPRVVSDAQTILQVSFAEASELAYFGVRVLHTKTILPAVKKNIPVTVLNSFNPESVGTLILNGVEKSKQIVKAITSKKNITLIHVDSKRMLGAYGFLARLFDVFYKYKQSIDVISTSEVSVSMTADNGKNLNDIALDLRGIAEVKVIKNKAVVCIVGEGMKHTPGVAGRIFSILGKNNINIEMISQGASEINITFIVDGKDAEHAIRVLHGEYFE
jgi:aspartate kinase